MGNYLGYPQPPKPEPEPTLLTKPWRKTECVWDEKYVKKIIQELKEFEVDETGQDEAENNEENVTQAKCLLLGPLSVGKSSFINSVISIGNGRYSNVAYTAGEEWGAVTTEFKYFGRRNDLGRKLSLCDVSGLMGAKGTGFNVENIIHLIKGNVRYGYKFNPIIAISEDDHHFRHKPTLQDKVHCAAFVISAAFVVKSDESRGLTDPYIAKIQRLQKALMENGVPRMLLLTKCDILCEEVRSDVKNIFKSYKVFNVVEKAAKMFAIPKSNIHPIVNHGEGQVYLDAAMSIPILLAVRQMMHFANDFIEIEAVRKSQETELVWATNP